MSASIDKRVGFRDDVLGEMRRELIGPAGGEWEFISDQPVYRYVSGMLFPADLVDEDDIEGEQAALVGKDEKTDPVIAASYDFLPASMGISFSLKGAKEFSCEVEGARYECVSVAELILVLQGIQPGSDEDEAVVAFLRNLPPAEVTPETVRRVFEADIDQEDEDAKAEAGEKAEQIIDRLAIGDRADSSETVDREIWRRRPLASASRPEVVEFSVPESSQGVTVSKIEVLSGGAEVQARFRPCDNGHVVTVSLVNTLLPDKSKSKGKVGEIEAMLFQSRFRVATETGVIGAYPDIRRFSRHPEDEELALTYRRRRTYGIGHGCAAVWESGGDGEGVQELTAETFPRFEVKNLTNNIEIDPKAQQALDIRWLGDSTRPVEELEEALEAFVTAYEQWVEGQKKIGEIEGFDAHAKDVAARLIKRQETAVKRMRGGVKYLAAEENQLAMRAFRMAQEAMARQFIWARSVKGGPFDLGDGKTAPIDLSAGESPKWFPFQIAFQLLVIESLGNPASAERKAVDLLWFPTGGGKTEAYLALAAFEMIHRRLKYQDSGTAVLMRYTLRLLTSQQFERCATLISVLEVMRRDRADELGEASFRLGLWVGGALTPNKLDNDNPKDLGATQLIEQMVEQENPENEFLLNSCPRCGTRLVPRSKSNRSAYGVFANASKFQFNCPEEECELHAEIPASIVDPDLFIRPPTFLIGTIDKFARMVWDPRSRVFLGCGRKALPPGLIIQDELHLINGPLGTIAGGYEAGIETVIQSRGGDPKYIAATATIQRAKEQCVALYGRASFIFPPPGLDASDSFYSKQDKDTPGRMYVGIMGNGMYSSLTTLVQVSAAAAQAPLVIPKSETLARDAYWTQVIYHNSRLELGRTMTMLRDDVVARLKGVRAVEEERRRFEDVEELSAACKGSELSRVLERMQRELQDPEGDGTIDAVACTNMISVGIDVSRLGLMLVKGQPKATAEFIQASSRVGRDLRERPPGIVLTMYTPFRPRDRSHFEGFQAFHQSLYRQVEPSSVTPFSIPARERTLHAGLVLSLRHAMGWLDEGDASKFDPADPDQKKIIDLYTERLLISCKEDEKEETAEHLDKVIEVWRRAADRPPPPPLHFFSGKQFRNLLAEFSESSKVDGHFRTLNSMRHVDEECVIGVRGQWRSDDGD